MDFFGQQAAAHRRSARLLLLFGLALVGFLFILGIAPSLLNALWSFATGAGWHWLWDWRVFALVVGGAGVLLLTGAAIEWLNLADGGPAFAARLGAEPLSASSRDEAARRLRNIVDEMAIASGRAAPRVFVLQHEPALNALTVGRHADDAVLVVTRGCLDRLSRDELQGVVAHEFSHLLHGDTVRDAHLTALLAGLLLIPEVGIDLLRAGWSEGTHPETHQPTSGPTPLIVLAPFGLLIVAAGFAGFLLARALQAGASRQREFLADASAVQFTRNPAGLAGVLTKIAAAPDQRLSGSAAAAKLGHLHFAAARRSILLDWFSTHPPLAARLAALERPLPPAATPTPGRAPLARNLADLAAVRAELGSFVGTAVTPGAEHVSYSQRLLASLPPAVLAAARTNEGAPAVVLGLLLSPEPAHHHAELGLVGNRAGPAVVAALSPLAGDIAKLRRAQRLPLLGLALPVLQSLPDVAKQNLLAAARDLAEHDAEVSLFEFALLQALRRRLAPRPPPSRPARATLAPFARPIAILLSTCARAAADTPEQALRGFASGAAYFSGLAPALELLPARNCGLDAVATALEALAAAPESYRRVLLAACARTVTLDRIVSPEESELIRAVADALDCPLPPLVGAP